MTRRSFIQTIGAIVGAALLPWANPTRTATLIGCGPRTCHWTGLYSDEWSDGRNWLDGDVPTDGDTVCVPQSEYPLCLTMDAPFIELRCMGGMVKISARHSPFDFTRITG